MNMEISTRPFALRCARTVSGGLERARCRRSALIVAAIGAVACREKVAIGEDDTANLSVGPALVAAKSAVPVNAPSRFAVFGNYVAVAEVDKQAATIGIFDKESGTLLSRSATSVNAVPEFREINSLQFRADTAGLTLWAFDPKNTRIVAFRIGNTGSLIPQEARLLAIVAGAPTSSLWLNDTTLIAAGLFAGGRFILLDRTAQKARPSGQIPYSSKELPPFAIQQALQPSIAVQPKGSGLAIGARYAGRIDIYHVPSDSLHPAKVPVAFDPLFRIALRKSVPQFQQDQSTRLGYISMTATATRIYALFSGRTRGGYPGRANVGRKVDMFDWNGEYLKSIRLDRDVYDIAVDTAGTELTAMVLKPHPALMRYPLEASNIARR